MTLPSCPAPLLRVLSGERLPSPPIWLMRQAGRYLPEYRAVRAEAGSFLDLCYNPRLAAEVTLQPIRRFGFDAAILFSDILVIPHALGQEVGFVENEGPRLGSLTDDDVPMRIMRSEPMPRLAPVLETVTRVRAALPSETALIGFCGAPWTVASYMVAGRSTPDQAPARQLAEQDPALFGQLIDRLVEVSARYLIAQLDAGADAVQIFESFAGSLTGPQFARWSLEPVLRMATAVRDARPNARLIVFARGASPSSLEALAQAGSIDAVGLGSAVELGFARDSLQTRKAVQGNLDPTILLAGGAALDRAVEDILVALGNGPHIFNLGHGILPETPIAHVEHLVRRVRGAPGS